MMPSSSYRSGLLPPFHGHVRHRLRNPPVTLIRSRLPSKMELVWIVPEKEYPLSRYYRRSLMVAVTGYLAAGSLRLASCQLCASNSRPYFDCSSRSIFVAGLLVLPPCKSSCRACESSTAGTLQQASDSSNSRPHEGRFSEVAFHLEPSSLSKILLSCSPRT